MKAPNVPHYSKFCLNYFTQFTFHSSCIDFENTLFRDSYTPERVLSGRLLMKGTGRELQCWMKVINSHTNENARVLMTHVQCSLLQEWLFSWILALICFHNSDSLKHLTHFPFEETPFGMGFSFLLLEQVRQQLEYITTALNCRHRVPGCPDLQSQTQHAAFCWQP